MTMTEYRKPDGKITESGMAYVKAWRKEIILPLERHYGLIVLGYDPSVSVKAKGEPMSPSAEIPLWLAKRMVKMARDGAVACLIADITGTGFK